MRATTSWDYTLAAADDLRYSPDHTTAIHKFALNAAGIEYRGSGTVQGHLGWTEDKKSFRMGENGAYLNVVTSIGDSWRNDSSTSLTVLKEGSGKQLQIVSRIDGIGKPGEQLYAARFVGKRAYLVTFRITDPLYVVDLSSQESPRIAGELEIAGYSDYLHPVSDRLLLGIGKDAIPDAGASDFGAQRGAWYQGLKVALFDVTDLAQPTEISSLVLGKRGTESEVLWDHHAFSYLPAAGNEPARFAIPLQLHDRTPTWGGSGPGSPAAWYEYTHTGLYSFEVGDQGISQVGRIIAQQNTGGPGRPVPLARLIGTDVISTSLPGFAPYIKYYGDRSVLMDDAVFYLHDGKLHSSLWGQNTTAD